MHTNIIIGDCQVKIPTLEDQSIDCIVTSPPYWGLRDYGHSDQLGLESTPEEYLENMINVFDLVKPKLKDVGNCFVNLGDTYSTKSGGMAEGKWNKLGHDDERGVIKQHKVNLPDKCLCMIPQRFAWGMIEHGWILRNEIIWHKPNHMPESVTDRLTKSHEVIYHFVKSTSTKAWKHVETSKWVFKKPVPDYYWINTKTGETRISVPLVPDLWIRKNKWIGYDYYYNLDDIRESFAKSSIKRITQKNVMNQTGGKKQTDLRGDPISGNASRCNKMVQSLAKKYGGKFDAASNHEDFGSPRARTQRKVDATAEHFIEKGSGGNTNSPADSPNGKNPGDMFQINEPIDINRLIQKWKELHPEDWAQPNDMWLINTQPYSEAHFAVFPIELIKRPILAGCHVGGMVLDPFGGSGTVAEFCRHNERECTIIELNDEYKPLIEDRSMNKTPILQSYGVYNETRTN